MGVLEETVFDECSLVIRVRWGLWNSTPESRQCVHLLLSGVVRERGAHGS